MLAAIEKGDAEELAELIRLDPPGFNVNLDHGNGVTLLHHACIGDRRSALIPLLLAHPDIDVNVKNRYGSTPFFFACGGYPSCVREMLKDSRVKVNEPDNDGHTPLHRAAHNGYLGVVEWWVASEREMDLGKPGNIYRTDAIGVAKKRGQAEVATLLERFKSDATKTRHGMRVKLGLLDDLAAEMFALVVFVSDGLLQIKDTAQTPEARFFNVVGHLPLELQMVLCFRLVGSGKEIIPGKDSEVAFKELAKRLSS